MQIPNVQASTGAATKKVDEHPRSAGTPQPAPRSPWAERRPRRAGEEELEATRAAGAAGAAGALPAGGPLGLHAGPGPAAGTPAAAAVEGVADRMLVGRDAAGRAEVRLELAVGDWKGTEVRLVAGARGIEATLVVPSEAARRVVEAQLAELARTLEGRGVNVARLELATRDEERRRDDERRRRREQHAEAW